ncbi:oligopeptide ABC transporter permease OppB [Algiphilus aromaticivorans]|jgi:oligopeptide transport system permease protein|uniref:oligopeptide ABC transporter permease OppB n=1 Tax=Algiphilus aromaticivorans TaxID=382454 RepID=UPI0005C157EB|nr:oligopeptide ABC transporter permease OppB [Algiphilus aromaticivorans]
MIGVAFRRLAAAVPTLLVLVTAAFFLMRAAPGGPFDDERVMPEEIRAQIEAAYHLDEPLWRQYLIYMGNLAQGDLGPSFRYEGRTVNELIGEGLPVSLTIGGLALALALTLGILAGTTAALRRGRATDHIVMGLSMTGISIPNFVIAPLLILGFAVYLGWLPAGGWEGASWRHLVLPVIALGLPQVAYVARLLRGSLIEVLSSDYIRTARAKGLPGRTIVLRHALRPALLPVLSYLGPAAAALITGSVVMEQIFGIPGLGRHFVQGALNRDYTLVLGLVLFYGALIIAFNFVVDVLYGVLDPRVGRPT